MKNYRYIAVVIVCMLVLVTGCSRTQENKKIDNDNKEEKPSIVEEFVIADTIGITDGEYGLYDISSKFSIKNDETLIQLEFKDSSTVIALFVDFSGENFEAEAEEASYTSRCVVYNFKEDKVMASLDEDRYMANFYVYENGYYIVYSYEQVIERYDKDFKLLDSYSLKQNESDDYYYNVFYDKDEDKFVVIDGTNCMIWIITGQTGEVKQVPIGLKDTTISPMYLDEDNDKIIVSAYSDIWLSGTIDCNNGQYKENKSYTNGIIANGIYKPYDDLGTKLVWRNIKEPRLEKSLYIDNKKYWNIYSSFIDEGENVAVVSLGNIDGGQDYMDIELSIYDIYNGTKLLDMTPEYIGKKKWTDVSTVDYLDKKEGILLISIYGENGYGVCLLDLEKATAKVEREVEQVYYDAAIISSSVQRRALALGEKHGIKIITGSEVEREFPDFRAAEEEDIDLVNDALTVLENLLDRIPEGFFEKFHYGGQDGLYIYLTGTLTQENSAGISNPAAFSLSYDNQQMIIVDVNITWSLIENFSHELSHAIDDYVDWCVDRKGTRGYRDEWYDLNPKGYDYLYSYKYKGEDVTAYNRPKYTPEDSRYYDDVNIAYFASGYGNSYPTEDRATIFENLLGVAPEGQLPEFYKSVNIRNKAEYMFKVIRECFEIPDATELYWERWW